MLDLLNANLLEMKAALENKEISSEELITFYLNRIEKYDKQINAYLSLNDNIINEAKIIDEKRSKNHILPPLQVFQ